ncbi:Protein of unknown function (DUF3105) [Streptoalloteichus tenebrarius]|uniref:DUF3105 domain-containing protein n=2 Tax=Streptoalloteichus tenebrarius (strain ATCC 17920 / DSM 40477 / JCM 4838 / CBS 697.72 / NBRC 16177 / NCIMB 11028 / NRRL B-12390 / A12253. 1 / ISP 5477) TaxID=1933 RepID=A0ABT1HXM2_STRSD|nr:DUF3105 domain-containing protein [Streptoalloteichus tenebrarius]MCP2260277.1 Protein of unknown function (DUF3105) [Streptoalloteichus tenebrarius]
MPKGRNSNRAVSAARSSMGTSKPKPWGAVAAVVVVLVFAGGVFGYVYSKHSANQEREAKLAQWTPSDANKDPSKQIPGVETHDYQAQRHVSPVQRVAYDKTPPFGGPHDGFWAACNGVVYDKAVRTENLVHSLEHGAVWIAYNPDLVKGEALDTLRKKVEGQQFMVMSPYPGLDKPISLQAWGHQLKLDDANDERVDHFVRSLRRNQFTYPEIGASCDALGPGQFDPDNPPAFDPAPPGPDAVPMTGGTDAAQQPGGMGQTG